MAPSSPRLDSGPRRRSRRLTKLPEIRNLGRSAVDKSSKTRNTISHPRKNTLRPAAHLTAAGREDELRNDRNPVSENEESAHMTSTTGTDLHKGINFDKNHQDNVGERLLDSESHSGSEEDQVEMGEDSESDMDGGITRGGIGTEDLFGERDGDVAREDSGSSTFRDGDGHKSKDNNSGDGSDSVDVSGNGSGSSGSDQGNITDSKAMDGLEDSNRGITNHTCNSPAIRMVSGETGDINTRIEVGAGIEESRKRSNEGNATTNLAHTAPIGLGNIPGPCLSPSSTLAFDATALANLLRIRKMDMGCSFAIGSCRQHGDVVRMTIIEVDEAGPPALFTCLSPSHSVHESAWNDTQLAVDLATVYATPDPRGALIGAAILLLHLDCRPAVATSGFARVMNRVLQDLPHFIAQTMVSTGLSLCCSGGFKLALEALYGILAGNYRNQRRGAGVRSRHAPNSRSLGRRPNASLIAAADAPAPAAPDTVSSSTATRIHTGGGITIGRPERWTTTMPRPAGAQG